MTLLQLFKNEEISRSHIKNSPSYNLGTFSSVSTHKEIFYNEDFVSMNAIDKFAYPEITKMEEEVIEFMSKQFHGDEKAVGFCTTGSSESIVLALSFHRLNFLTKHPELQNTKLNFIVNEGYHKIFEKYAALFNVDIRAISLDNNYRINVKKAEQAIDENTFCLVGIMGSTELGKYDDIAELNKLAIKHSIPVHVDAAIGGFVVPFSDVKVEWDFALSNVQSINASGHKYGLSCPGIGVVLFKDKNVLPANYDGKLDYISGGSVVDYGLSCTKNAAFIMILCQNIKFYGEEGYKKITRYNYDMQEMLVRELRQNSKITDIVTGDAPLVLFKGEKLQELSDYLLSRGWVQHPSYVAPLKDKYIRIVIKKHLSKKVLGRFLQDVHYFYYPRKIFLWKKAAKAMRLAVNFRN